MLAFFYKHVYYAFLMGTRPQTLAALADSPVGLATFMIDHDARSLELIARSFDGVSEGLPVAVSVFPGELYTTPRSWAEPEFLVNEMREGFRSLR